MKKRKLNKRRIIIIILIVITFCNSYFIAKYTSSLVGNSSKNIAKWTVECNSTSPDTLSLVSGNIQGSYILRVKSQSEVSAKYSVILNNVPSELEVKIDDNEFQTPENNIVAFNNIGTFTVNDNNTYNHTITFNAPLDSSIPSINSIDIDVIFDQVN